MDKVLQSILNAIGNERGAKTAFLSALSMPSSTIGDWKSGRNKSYMKRLPEIAAYFDVTVDALLADTIGTDQDIANTDGGVLDNILREMKNKGINQKTMCEALGLNKQAFTNWKNGGNDSYLKKLPQIAKVLEVSIDSLLEPENASTAALHDSGLSAKTENMSADREGDAADVFYWSVLKRPLSLMTSEQRMSVLRYAQFILAKDGAVE